MKFNIQLHKSSKEHHDFRLERNGVLVSWAVPQRVPSKSGLKRLAVQVEDHSLDYLDFEGTIEDGYGAGTVKLMDTGEYTLEKWEPDKIVVNLHGSKYQGHYVLIRFKGSENDWLIFRKKEQA